MVREGKKPRIPVYTGKSNSATKSEDRPKIIASARKVKDDGNRENIAGNPADPEKHKESAAEKTEKSVKHLENSVKKGEKRGKVQPPSER